MKEKENTSPTPTKKKLIYSIVVAVCALLLIAATILTVYFVTNSGKEVLENPPVGDDPDKDPDKDTDVDVDPGTDPDKDTDVDADPGTDPNTPSSGETVAFIKPIDSAVCSVEYGVIYGNTSTDKWYRHMAIDFEADAGTSVCAMADGVVKTISMEEILGNYIVIEHEDGITTTYRFVEPVAGLREGDTVRQGQTIATVAEAYGTEYKDGTHLHLEMTQNGKYVDPTAYIDITFEEK